MRLELQYPFRVLDYTKYPEDILEKARNIKLILFDVDGVFTDGKLYFDAEGNEVKVFNVYDGYGIRFIQRLGIKVGVITGRNTKAVAIRMRDLNVELIFQGISDKASIYEKILSDMRLNTEEVAFVGDDLPDLEVMLKVGLPIATKNAIPHIKSIARWVTPKFGGEGAVRDVCELIIASMQEKVLN